MSDGHGDSYQSELQSDGTPDNADFSKNGEKQDSDSGQTLDKSEQLETSKEKLREILNRELSVFCEKMCSSRTGDVSKEQETNERHEVAEGFEGNAEHEDNTETDSKESTANHKSGNETIAEEIDNMKRKLTDDLIGVLCSNEGKIYSLFQIMATSLILRHPYITNTDSSLGFRETWIIFSLYYTGLTVLRRLATVSSTFPTAIFLKDKYYHCLTSNATIPVWLKCLIIGKQVAIILFYITGYHGNTATY